MRKIKRPKISQYILATGYRDKDPNDPWYVSTVKEVRQLADGTILCYLNDGDGRYWKHFWSLTLEEGERLIKEYLLKEGQGYSPK